MKLYPPFKVWRVKIVDSVKFRSYIWRFEHGGIDGMEGKVNENSFKVEVQHKFWSTGRPQICGVLEKKDQDQEYLSMHLEALPLIPRLMSGLSLMLIALSIFQSNPKMLIGIPVIICFFYVVGLVLYLAEIDDAKSKLETIMKRANEKFPE